MLSGFSLSARETSLVSDVVWSMEQPSTWPLPWPALQLFQDLLHADALTLTDFDSALPRVVYQQFIHESGERGVVSETATEAHQNPFWQVYWDIDKGCGYPDITGDYSWVKRASDGSSLRQLRAEHRGDPETFSRHYLLACMPGHATGRHARMQLWRREGPDFTEREVILMTLLKPHVELAVRRATSERVQRQLTARQLQVMRMVRAGLTNRQIATRIGVSEGTVHVHLTNTYNRLGVQSRTAAVQAVFDSADESPMSVLLADPVGP